MIQFCLPLWTKEQVFRFQILHEPFRQKICFPISHHKASRTNISSAVVSFIQYNIKSSCFFIKHIQNNQSAVHKTNIQFQNETDGAKQAVIVPSFNTTGETKSEENNINKYKRNA